MTSVRNEIKAVNPETIENSLICSISAEPVDTATPCGHLFEKKAITDWINDSNKKDEHGNCARECPLCNTPISVPQLVTLYGLSQIAAQTKQDKDKIVDLSNKLIHAEIKLQTGNIDTKENKNITQIEKTTNGCVQTTAAIGSLLRQQQALIQQRNQLMTDSVPKIRANYKKLGEGRQRIQEMEARIKKNLPPEEDPWSGLESDTPEKCEKYRKAHAKLAKETETKLIDPYIEKLTELNKKIENNKENLHFIREQQKRDTAKLALQSRVATLFAAKLVGGTGKITALKLKVSVQTPEIKPEKKVSAIEHVKQTGKLLEAIRTNNLAVVAEALQNGANPNFVNDYGTPLVIRVVKESNVKILRKLIEHNANINAQDRNGLTALHVSAGAGDINLSLALLEMGADPRISSMYSGTPARYMEHQRVTNALLKDLLTTREAELNQMEQQIMNKR